MFKKNLLKVIILFVIAIIIGIDFISAFAVGFNIEPSSKNYNVLIINSYHNGHKWEDNINEGVNKAIELSQSENIVTKVEYLDFRHNFKEEYIDKFIDMLEVKYPKGSIDAIYAVNNEAFLTIRKEISDEESSFYKIPLIFSGVNGEIIIENKEREYITGIYERDDTVQLLNLICDIDNDLNLINVILEDSAYGESIKNEINQELNDHWNGKFKVNYIEGDYIEDIESQLGEAIFNENSSVIIAGEFQYKNNDIYVKPEDTIKIIKKYTFNPIYSNDQTYIDAGILGGCIDRGQEHGENIINMVKEIISGREISNMESILEPEAKKFINYEEIYEFNINPFDIPLYSMIRNKKFYELLIPNSIKYMIFIVGIGVVILIVNLINKSNKLSIEKKRRIKQEEFEKLRTDHIINMSHELRTPLNIILNTIKILDMKIKNKDMDPDYFKARLDSVSKNSFRLLKLINNFIDISKCELGFLKVNLIDEDIVEVSSEIFESVKEYCNKKDISLKFESKEDKVIMAIDKEKIQRVILNILSNAIKFTDEGGNIEGFIEIINNNIIIRIKDTGIGIPRELLNNIFFKFYQIDDILTRRSEGSGIGLYICNDIIKLHNGEIIVESEVGIGSIFSIKIPITICNKDSSNNYLISNGNEVKLEMSDIY